MDSRLLEDLHSLRDEHAFGRNQLGAASEIAWPPPTLASGYTGMYGGFDGSLDPQWLSIPFEDSTSRFTGSEAHVDRIHYDTFDILKLAPLAHDAPLDRPSSRMCHHTQLTDEPSKDFEVNKLLDIIKTALRGICATASTPLLDRAIDALTGHLCDMQSRRQALGADHQAVYPVDMPHDEAWTEPNLPPPADSVNPMTATSGITGVAQDGDPKILICRYGGCGLMLHGAISVKTIKQHLQENHGVAPRSSQSFTCGWTELGGTPCSTSLRAGGLAKHVCDVHLRIGAKSVLSEMYPDDLWTIKLQNHACIVNQTQSSQARLTALRYILRGPDPAGSMPPEPSNQYFDVAALRPWAPLRAVSGNMSRG
ncbi:hypothetical protein EVJ58_g6478 [Rhodofomes roseus]|uniref:Uncharacterized protein n=1 Tax=Rhodofomes roseus TaxID=34475 RepID=A0A4Y9Y8F5_9APHY|nr:hypothetical protein EVJ58_g6478 [Rhodofomes roseus]